MIFAMNTNDNRNECALLKDAVTRPAQLDPVMKSETSSATKTADNNVCVR